MSERLEYIRTLEAQIVEAQATLDRLKAEHDHELQALQHEEIDRLEEHLASARISLSGISSAAEDAWHELRESVDTVRAALRLSVSKLLKR